MEGAQLLQGRWTHSRPLRDDDLPFLYQLLTDPVIGASLRYQGATPSFDEFARHAWDGVLAQWTVLRAKAEMRAGIVVLSTPDFRNGYAYLSVIGHPDVLGNGVMMDGVASVLAHVFATWPFRRLYFEVAEDNFRQFSSGLGEFFVEEGRRAEQVFGNGRFQDVHLLTLTRERWYAQAEPAWLRLRSHGK